MMETESTSNCNKAFENNADGEIKLDDLTRVKELTQKLQLSIKRRSVLQWKLIIEEKNKKGLLGSKIGKPAESRQSNFFKENDGNVKTNNNSASLQNVTSFQVPEASSILNSNCTTKLSSKRTKSAEKSNSNLLEKKIETRNGTDDPESERRRKISEVLFHIRKELILMNLEDHALARKLLDIRADINRERAALTCAEHAQLLDFVSWEIEEEKQFNKMHKVGDVSSALLRQPDSLLSSPTKLRNMRINKTNFEFKRFSVI